MKGMKRIFALVLSFVMIFTAMPVIGNAEENKLADVEIVLDNSDSDKGTLTMSTDKPYVAEGVIITATAKEGYRVIDIVPDKEIYVVNGFKYTQKGNNGEAVFIAYDYKDTFTFKAVYEDIRTTKVAIYDNNREHGEVKLSKRDVPFGEELTIKTFPNEGYGTEYIKFNGETYNEETITVKNTGWGDRQTVYVNFKPSSKVSTGLMFLDESENEISGINCGTVTVNKSVLKTNEELNIKCEPKDGYEYAHMEIKTIVDGKLKTIKYCYEKEFNFKSAE